MENKMVSLTTEQLQYVYRYIGSRSTYFQDPIVMLEILDHVACKVEEIMTQDASISLETAVAQAHQSFGVRGFKPIADLAHESLDKGARKWLKKMIPTFFISTYGLIAIIIACIHYFYFEKIIGVIHSWQYDDWILSFYMLTVVIVVQLFYLYQVKWSLKSMDLNPTLVQLIRHNTFIGKVGFYLLPFWVVCFSINIDDITHAFQLQVVNIMFSLFIIGLLFNAWLSVQMKKKLITDATSLQNKLLIYQ